MQKTFSYAFKKQAVEKALNRSVDTGVSDVAKSLGIGYSTLKAWTSQFRHQTLATDQQSAAGLNQMKNEKRPQDWGQEEKLEMVIACGTLDESRISALCREKGIYPHHVEQWKKAFMQEQTLSEKSHLVNETKQLKQENKELKKELRRKEKALAEAAALLVLQKKVNAIWGNNEDD
jgi:transposase-like protein